MKVTGRKVELRASEVDDASCPIDPRWAALQIRRYGLSLVAESKKLSRFGKCPGVLAEAGYEVVVVDDGGSSTAAKSSAVRQTPASERKESKRRNTHIPTT